MPISVHCPECGKTYQLRSDMAGRKGKCPNGHTLMVPAPVAAPAPAAENEFAFDTAARSRHDAEPSKRQKPRETPETSASEESEFAFDSKAPPADEQPEAGRSRYGQRATSRDSAAARKSMIPVIVGGVLAMVGIGLGVTLFLIARAEVAPLREQAEAAARRADEAELKTKTAEAVAAAARAELGDLKKTSPAPPSDPALKSAQSRAAAAEKKVAELESKLKELETRRPAGEGKEPTAKNDPPAPKPDMPGGKNWTAPATFMAGPVTHKAGDRLTIRPKEDAALKAAGGIMRIKFRYMLAKGKELPMPTHGTAVILEPGSAHTLTIPVTLTGEEGETEVAFDVKGFTGMAGVAFFISDGKLGGNGRNLTVYSSFISTMVDFEAK
jgi:hypothetical protein